MKRVLLLINTGTPDRADRNAVGRYLREFLNDKRVIQMPRLLRLMLVNLIIIPFRVKKSTALYRRLWTADGSPLLVYLNRLVDLVARRSSHFQQVYGAMRYGNPSIKSVLADIQSTMPDELVVMPLFPQYASATTGSVAEEVMRVISRWPVIPTVRFVQHFYQHEVFINLFASRIESFQPHTFDHIVFSYHGLPLKHLSDQHPSHDPKQCSCSEAMPAHGRYCYRAACYETTHQLIARLALDPARTTTSFQSRLTRNWLSPFSDEVIFDLARQGKRRILVVAPSFVADCLETIIEIEQDYKALFVEHGGDELVMVQSLNDSPDWADAIIEIAG